MDRNERHFLYGLEQHVTRTAPTFASAYQKKKKRKKTHITLWSNDFRKIPHA